MVEDVPFFDDLNFMNVHDIESQDGQSKSCSLLLQNKRLRSLLLSKIQLICELQRQLTEQRKNFAQLRNDNDRLKVALLQTESDTDSDLETELAKFSRLLGRRASGSLQRITTSMINLNDIPSSTTASMSGCRPMQRLKENDQLLQQIKELKLREEQHLQQIEQLQLSLHERDLALGLWNEETDKMLAFIEQLKRQLLLSSSSKSQSSLQLNNLNLINDSNKSLGKNAVSPNQKQACWKNFAMYLERQLQMYASDKDFGVEALQMIRHAIVEESKTGTMALEQQLLPLDWEFLVRSVIAELNAKNPAYFQCHIAHAYEEFIANNSDWSGDDGSGENDNGSIKHLHDDQVVPVEDGATKHSANNSISYKTIDSSATII